MTALIIIPARLASTRFPGKPMAMIRGCSMIERVWRIANSVSSDKRVVIATDDAKLAKFVGTFGAESVMTSAECPTGMDRAAETFRLLGFEASSIISLQADAVLTPPWVIEEVVKFFSSQPKTQIVTPAVRLSGKTMEDFIFSKQQGSSTGTTVVCDKFGKALYFSKGIVPHCRKAEDRQSILRHIGLYLFRPEVLAKLSDLPESNLERTEKLEQLRALENGFAINVIEVDYRGRTHASVDNPEDIALVEEIIRREGEILQV